jgi:long-chain fatty acid transport protein
MSGVRVSVQALVVAASALAVSASVVQAGGLAVREQSTSAQGSSFAGSAAGYDLSSGFWNPAAFGIAGSGLTTESHYALIIPDANLSLTSASTLAGGPGGANSTDIGHLALIPASYGAYRINKDLVLGLSINSPFGLATKPEDVNWAGRYVGTTAKMFTANATPTLSYQVAPGLIVGAGVQLEYMSLKFKFGFPGVPATADHGTAIADINDDVSVGYTAGVLWQPSKSTSIGLGFRSSITHDMDGSLTIPTGPTSFPVSARFENPEIVTLSIRQAIAPHLRLLGTVEWTNWSRFGVIPINGTAALGGGTNLQLPGNWHDGWLYSAGLEYDVNRAMTVRTGIAFEKSPIQNATERLIQVPDSDRWWVSGGLSYKWSERTSFDLAYTHIFFDDAPFKRTSLTGFSTITGSADQSADIVSVSIKNKW